MADKRILLVDDHPVLREGLAAYIDGCEGLSVCAQAGSAEEAADVIGNAVPDLAVVDITLPGASGLEWIKALRSQGNETPLLVYSMHDESVYAERSIKAGARGYIEKGAPSRLVLDAIERILGGDVYLSEKMTKRLVEGVAGASPAHRSSISKLTDRELQVFHLIGTGQTTAAIAKKLGLAVKTIETYRENIKTRLGLRNATELVKAAVLWVEGENSGNAG